MGTTIELKSASSFEDQIKLNGGKIRFYRDQKDMTQSELAEAVGVNENYISMIESGRKNPSYRLLFNISVVLEVQIYKLQCD